MTFKIRDQLSLNNTFSIILQKFSFGVINNILMYYRFSAFNKHIKFSIYFLYLLILHQIKYQYNTRRNNKKNIENNYLK
jgi:hypothetical protein